MGMEAARKVASICPTAVIAGGYPRDIYLGTVLPKDIDIFIPLQNYGSETERQRIVEELFESFGQVGFGFRDSTPQAPAIQMQILPPGFQPLIPLEQPYGGIEGGAFETYRSLTPTGDWEPINIIFKEYNDIFDSFDWDICLFSITQHGLENYYEGNGRRTTFIGSGTRSQPMLLDHTNRIKAKYPDLKFLFPAGRLYQLAEDYRTLVQGGVIGNAGQVLPTEGESTTGDAVGFVTGARLGRRTASTVVQAAIAEHDRRVAEHQRARAAAEGQWTGFFTTTRDNATHTHTFTLNDGQTPF